MKSRLGTRIILFIMVLVIGSFDRHLSNYFPGEVQAMIQSDAFPAHSDLPVKSCDYHEDITLKVSNCALPGPVEFTVQDYRDLHMNVPRISPHTMWQPPEKNT